MDIDTQLEWNRTGQELDLYPPEWVLGVPSAATYTVFSPYKSNDDTSEFSGSATSDSVSTTVDQASGYSQTNKRRLYIASTTSISTQRHYLLENANGQRERVRPIAIASGDYLDLDRDLSYDYPVTTSTLKGLRQSFTVDATFIQDESKLSGYIPDQSAFSQSSGAGVKRIDPYRIRWSYTVASATYRHWSYFTVVRAPEQSGLTFADLAELDPDIGYDEPLDQQGQKWLPQLSLAREEFGFQCRAHGVDPSQFREQQDVDHIVRQFWLAYILEYKAVRSPDMIAAAERHWARATAMFQQGVGVLKLAVDQGKEGNVTREPFRQPAFRR